MTADRPRKKRNVQRQTGQVIAPLGAFIPRDFPGGLHHAHRSQSFPLHAIGKPAQLIALEVAADFDTKFQLSLLDFFA